MVFFILAAILKISAYLSEFCNEGLQELVYDNQTSENRKKLHFTGMGMNLNALHTFHQIIKII
jgi:hypothetical protein